MYLPTNRLLKVGRLGWVLFEAGIYLYVGSGGRSPIRRVARHIRKRKRKFWHIDFLTVQSRVIGAFILDSDVSLECTVAQALGERFTAVPGFGASDCRCGSHLFFAGPDAKEV
jgi:sugar fermentation stimulation protein A